MIPMEFFLVFAGILFCLGLYGMMTTDKALVALMSVELMLNAAIINFIAFGAFNGDIMGEAFVIMSISVAAAEVAVGIAILLNAYKNKKTTELDDAELRTLRW